MQELFHCKDAGAWFAGTVQSACHMMTTWPTIWADSQGRIPVLSAEDTLHRGCALPPADAPERLSLAWLLLPIEEPGHIAGALQPAAGQTWFKSASLQAAWAAKQVWPLAADSRSSLGGSLLALHNALMHDLQDWQGKGSGLAAASLCRSHDVSTAQDERQRL